MNKSFVQLNRLLREVWPAISAIEWSAYATTILDYDDTGVPKATGIIAHFATVPMLGGYTQVYGFLPRPERSAQIVVRKVRLLQANQNCTASMKVRNPHANEWGGGVRSSRNADEIYALSGLPEIGDHLICVELMRECGLLTKDICEHQDLTDPETTYMTTARSDVGMSIRQFEDLQQRISNIIHLS